MAKRRKGSGANPQDARIVEIIQAARSVVDFHCPPDTMPHHPDFIRVDKKSFQRLFKALKEYK